MIQLEKTNVPPKHKARFLFVFARNACVQGFPKSWDLWTLKQRGSLLVSKPMWRSETGRFFTRASDAPGVGIRVQPTRSKPERLWKHRVYIPLTRPVTRTSGRNNTGRITVRHRGGGHKRLLRVLDYQRVLGESVQVQRIEYDPNRSAWIALVKSLNFSQHKHKHKALFSRSTFDRVVPNKNSGNLHTSSLPRNDQTTTQMSAPDWNRSLRPGSYVTTRNSGKMRYWLATHEVQSGAILNVTAPGQDLDVRPGNTSRLCDIPIGTRIHHVELYPGQGAQLLRAAGVSGFLISKHLGRATIRLGSGQQIQLQDQCLATIGQASNITHHQRVIGKAGRSRWLGWRPTVRGVAMNPVDHPHGGGEGKTSGGRPSCSPWGKPTKGYRTKRRRV